MDALTEKNLKALAGRSIAHVNVRSPDVVELAVPESEGWRLGSDQGEFVLCGSGNDCCAAGVGWRKG